MRLAPWILLLALAGTATADEAVNEYCPILRHQQAKAEHATVYEGKEVRFCCSSCQRVFETNPEPHLHALPQFAAAPGPVAVDFEELGALVRERSYLLALPLLLLIWVALDLRQRRRTGKTLAATLAANAHGVVVAAALVFLTATAVLAWRNFELERKVDQLEEDRLLLEMKEAIHNNTYADFGDPPVPIKPPVPPRLEALFYRGNDERDPKLFNHGNYLTARFDLSLRVADGRKVSYGDAVGGEGTEVLFVRLEIQRGPHTPDFFWQEEVMGIIFLTQASDPFLGYTEPVADRVGLTTLEPMQRWEALYPIGKLTGTGEERLEGIVYVADEWRRYGQMMGATFHYAVQWDVAVSDGVIQPSSDLWMGALFRPRKTPLSRIPNEEWFSHLPIPELPEPQIDDPELLGVSDYVTEGT